MNPFGNRSGGGGSGGSPGGSGGAGFGGFPGFGGSGSGGWGGGMFDQMLEWCSKHHAMDIARRQGIDVKDIHFKFDGKGGVTVQVDAPNASQQQIKQLGEAVQQECPVAKYRKASIKSNAQEMQWIQLPPR